MIHYLVVSFSVRRDSKNNNIPQIILFVVYHVVYVFLENGSRIELGLRTLETLLFPVRGDYVLRESRTIRWINRLSHIANALDHRLIYYLGSPLLGFEILLLI